VSVTTQAIDLIAVDGNKVTLRVECSAGFYVRALAHDLGERLGIGAHLLSLRRTRSGDITLDQGLTLDAIERDPACGVRAIIPLSRMLPGLLSVILTSEGVRHAVHGRDLGPGDTEKGVQGPYPFFVRLIDPAGDLVAIAAPKGALGLLHPAVVLM
jgi:tRNA pseudouridine55 synthase